MRSQFHQSVLNKTLFLTGLALAPVFGYLIWNISSSPATLSTLSKNYATPGTAVQQDLQIIPAQAIQEEDKHYTITDTTSDGIDISFANQPEESNKFGSEASKSSLSLSFPKNYAEPVQIKLDDRRTIEITDLGAQSGDYTANTLSNSGSTAVEREEMAQTSLWQRIFKFGSEASKKEETQSYLRYQSKDGRKELLYAYQKDQGNGEKKLKHWTLYKEGTGLEQESYQFKNAKLRINGEGVAEVFYYGDQELKNDQVVAEVDTNLMERAQRTLAKEMGEDIINGTSGKTPDFTIPKPYYIDRNGDSHEAEWRVNAETSVLSVTLDLTQQLVASEASQLNSSTASLYPIALDPTLSFTAPSQSNTGSVITGEKVSEGLGASFVAGDFNADGRMDLAVGATGGGATNGGRVYLFYNDGHITSVSTGADVTITAPTLSNLFGSALAAGDMNGDGRTDLVASGDYHNSVWIFYNDGSYPTVTGSADVHISGDESTFFFGKQVVTSDFNFDGRVDLAVSDDYISTQTGKVYIFYSDGTNNYGTASCTGSAPTECLASNADVKITGNASGDYFGQSMQVGDYDADGRTDLIIGGPRYNSGQGRVYLFRNDGSIPTTAATADVTLTGDATGDYFGWGITTGDFNADGKIDVAVGAHATASQVGKVYIFYNGSIITESASGADVTITGTASSIYGLGVRLAAGDMNSDGRTDLIVAAFYFTSEVGQAYVFYNDGAYPSGSANADVIVKGQNDYDQFGTALGVGDWNGDGRADLAIGAPGYTGSTGRAYIFYSQNGQVNTNQNIVGNASSDEFGKAMVTGDFNADGRTDLAVGAPGYSGSTGRVYLFYGDGQIPSTAGTADVTITGTTAGDQFGISLSAGDLDSTGTTDLLVGANGVSTSTGKAYIFYNDSGGMPTTAATADIIIVGETTSNYFGESIITGDFNTDGRIDVIVSAHGNSSNNGRVYIFYNDGTSLGTVVCTTGCLASNRDAAIDGSASHQHLGQAMMAGAFKYSDNKTGFVLSANYGGGGYSYADIFYNDGSYPSAGASADVVIDNDQSVVTFAGAAGDFNTDGHTDIALGFKDAFSSYGRVYLYYNDGTYPTTRLTADVTIAGSTGDLFGNAVVAGDFNADGRTDLAVGESAITTNTGKVFVYYNDGSIPTTDVTADTIITGETTSNYFSYAMTAGDMNGDGRTDLVVGAYGNATSTGKVYFYETRENFAWQIQKQFGNTPRTSLNTSGQEMQITGEVSSDFGGAMIAGDFNADGKIDLAVGAPIYTTNTGRVYIFYSDGSLAGSAINADVILNGSGTYMYFGGSLAAGDLNTDGRTDLIVGAYSIFSESVYIFYNDGVYPAGATTADVVITGDASTQFGTSLAVADLNTDGRSDLVVGAQQYSTYTGRAYVFYADGTNNYGTATCSGTPSACSAGNADAIITGEGSNYFFGYTLTTGDFNVDGKIDVAVGSYEYGPYFGRVYIFYSGSIITENASGADVIMTGNASGDRFGSALTSGDFNTDGRTDIAVGANIYGSGTGRAYIFYGGSIITEGASGADVTITGTGGYFGSTLSVGDLNSDGRTDLVVGEEIYSSGGNYFGRIHIFNNDGSYPASATDADVTLTGEVAGSYLGHSFAVGDWNADGKADLAVGAYRYPNATDTGKVYVYTFNDPVITGNAASDQFGYSLTTGDLNADGKTDLVVGATGYNPGGAANTGRAYVFYNDGTIPSTAATADVTITGNATGDSFGGAFAVGDFDADGRIDLAVGASGYSTSTGRAYLFYNDGSIPTTAATADVIITGEASSSFGASLTSGDFNADGKTDLVVGGYVYPNNNVGRVYVFYNDVSIPTTAASADAIISGEGVYNSFGYAFAAGDLNNDGKTDLVVGANNWNNNGDGKVYFFYNGAITTENASGADYTITGSAESFGTSLAVADFDADGDADLAVGAMSYSSYTGRTYVFYNDGSIPTTSGTADAIITGESTFDSLGSALQAGDFNADGKVDLAAGASIYGSNDGRVYIFYNGSIITENASVADVTISAETTTNYFGSSLVSGDFNADGKVDLAVGAYGYSSSKGRVYLFTSEVAGTSTPPGTSYLKGAGKLKGTMKWK